MLVATSVCGVIFALCSGQPLIIIGATGPIIVFEEALYKVGYPTRTPSNNWQKSSTGLHQL